VVIDVAEVGLAFLGDQTFMEAQQLGTDVQQRRGGRAQADQLALQLVSSCR
jgi:hypothetical protein